MTIYAGRIILHPAMHNPTIVVITDCNDLDDQRFGAFARCRDPLRQPPVQAANRADLRAKLAVASGGVVFTTIQRFFPEEKGERHPQDDRARARRHRGPERHHRLDHPRERARTTAGVREAHPAQARVSAGQAGKGDADGAGAGRGVVRGMGRSVSRLAGPRASLPQILGGATPPYRPRAASFVGARCPRPALCTRSGRARHKRAGCSDSDSPEMFVEMGDLATMSRRASRANADWRPAQRRQAAFPHTRPDAHSARVFPARA